jgi:hypothetical protein
VKNKFVLPFSITCTYLCILGLILTLKNPVCIDSSVVERLDSVSASEIQAAKAATLITETAYSCDAHKATTYSEKLIATEGLVTKKLKNVISVLESIQKFKNKIQIIVRFDKPLMFEIQNSKLIIGSSLLAADGHLQRGIVKIWTHENESQMQIQANLFEDVVSDFLYFIINGDVSIEDPLTGIKTKLGSAQWPQVLKSTEAYCDSSWKASEHYQICGLLEGAASEEIARQMMTLSLRPLLSSSLISSYKNLNFTNQQNLLKNFSQFLRKRTMTPDKRIEFVLQESNPLKQGILNIKSFSDLFVSADLLSQQEYKQLYAGLTSELQNAGFSDSFAEAYFDFMIEVPDQISAQSSFFKNIEAASKKNLNLQIALKDQNQIWIMPSRTALPLSAFDKIKSRQNIYFACSGLKEIKIEQFFEQTEKLMMIKGCDQNQDYKFSSLFEVGLKEFIRLNEKIKFVQFHIPSLEMKQAELAHVNNFFELVENRDVNRQEFRTLGWSQIQWSDEYHAYKPKAAIEAIEFFRN